MTSNWIVCPKPRAGAKIQLICLPFAGGGSNSFRNWVSLLPASVELIAVEIPGRGQRMLEPLRHRMQELIPDMANAVQQAIRLPFALFGHSMGTLLGYELTHHLHREFEQLPEHLFFSGRGAPHLPGKEAPIHQLPDDEFFEQIKNYNGTPREVLEHEELMELMLPVLRADFEVCETYRFREYPPLPVPLTVFGGLQDVGAPRDYLQAWKAYTGADFNLRMFPGDHFYLINQHVALLQSILRDLAAFLN